MTTDTNETQITPATDRPLLNWTYGCWSIDVAKPEDIVKLVGISAKKLLNYFAIPHKERWQRDIGKEDVMAIIYFSLSDYLHFIDVKNDFTNRHQYIHIVDEDLRRLTNVKLRKGNKGWWLFNTKAWTIKGDSAKVVLRDVLYERAEFCVRTTFSVLDLLKQHRDQIIGDDGFY